MKVVEIVDFDPHPSLVGANSRNIRFLEHLCSFSALPVADSFDCCVRSNMRLATDIHDCARVGRRRKRSLSGVAPRPWAKTQVQQPQLPPTQLLPPHCQSPKTLSAADEELFDSCSSCAASAGSISRLQRTLELDPNERPHISGKMPSLQICT